MFPSGARGTILYAILVISTTATRGDDLSIDIEFPKKLPPEAVQVLGSATLRSYHVNRLAFSSDGKRLAASNGDTVQLWDTATGNQIAERRRGSTRDTQRGPLFQFVDEDRLLIHGDSVHRVDFWNLTTFASESRVIRDVVQGFAETPLAASADGSRVLFTRSARRTETGTAIVVRSSPQGRAVFERVLQGDAQATISPDGKRVAYFSSDRNEVAEQVFVRNLDDDIEFPPIGPFHRGAEAAFFSPDGLTLFVVDRNTEVSAWNVETGKMLRTLYPPDKFGVRFVADLSRDGRRFVVTAHEGGVVVLDTTTGTQLRQFPKHPHKFVRAAALSADGTLLAIGGEQNVVEIWNVDRGTRHVDPVGHYEHIYAVAAAPDGRSVAMIDPGRLLLWNRAGEITTSAETSNFSFGAMNDIRLNFTPDGRSIIAMLGHGRIEFRDATTLSTRFTVQRRQPYPMLSAMSPGLEATACVLSGNAVKLQPGPHAVEGKRPNYDTFAGPERPIVRLEFSIDGAWLAANAEDGEVLVWPTTQRNRSFRWRTGAPVTCLAVGGQYAATGAHDGVVRLWEVAEGRELQRWSTVETAKCPPTALAFDAALSRLAAGYDDGSVRLFNLDDRDEETIVPPRKDRAAVSRLGWSSDGQRLGIGLADEQFGVWPGAINFADAATKHCGPVTFIGWLPDERIAIGNTKGANQLDAKSLNRVRSAVCIAEGDAAYAIGVGFYEPRKQIRCYMNDGEVYGESSTGSFRRVDELHFHDDVGCSALSPDGRTFAATTETALLIWNDPQGPQTAEYPLAKGWQHKVEYLRNSQYVAVRDNGLSIRRVSDGQETAHIPQPERDEHFNYHCSPTDDVVAIETGNRIMLHDVGKRRAARDIELQAGHLWEFAFTPDGAQIIALSWDKDSGADLIVAEVASRQVLHRIKLANRWPRDFAVLDGGRSAVVASGDGLGIIWTLRPAEPAEASKTATVEQMEMWWRDLAVDDPAKVYAAIWGLTESGDAAVEFLARRLPPSLPNNEPLMLRVGRLIADLGDDGEPQKEAIQQLTAMRPYADDELHQLLSTDLPAKVRMKIEALLSSQLKSPSAKELRLCRAAQILGRIGGTAARERLKTMQNSLPERPSTAAAKRAGAYLKQIAEVP